MIGYIILIAFIAIFGYLTWYHHHNVKYRRNFYGRARLASESHSLTNSFWLTVGWTTLLICYTIIRHQ